MSRAKHSLVSGIIIVALLGVSLWVWGHRQYIQDWMVVQRYTPTSEIVSIADQVGFTDYGRLLFYASEPEVSNADTFNTRCGRKESGTAILGCYSDGGIYLYRITNKELDGIEQVTAAHEMLHAAWERMTDQQRTEVAGELEKAYQRVKTAKLEERMGYYERQQTGARANELHSILGTESTELGEALEKHYREYFKDRQAIVAMHKKYEAVFTALEDKAEAIRKELETEAPKINNAIAAHNQAVDALNRTIIQHNQAASSVDRKSAAAVEAYNAKRAFLQSEQVRLEEEQRAIDKRRVAYNKRLDEYNALIIRSTTLTNSIDSFKAPANISE